MYFLKEIADKISKIPERRMDKRNLLADIAESVLYIWEEKCLDNKGPRKAIEALRNERVTQKELMEAANTIIKSAENVWFDCFSSDAAIWAGRTAVMAALGNFRGTFEAAANTVYCYQKNEQLEKIVFKYFKDDLTD